MDDVLKGLITKILAVKTPKNNKNLLLFVAEILQADGQKEKSFEVLKSLFEVHG